MYRFSRAIYQQTRELVAARTEEERLANQRLLLSGCEHVIERIARDPSYYPDPARELFGRIRRAFPIIEQRAVKHVVERYIEAAVAFAAHELAQESTDAALLRCRAFTRDGTPCQRPPMPEQKLCPSHLRQAERQAAS